MQLLRHHAIAIVGLAMLLTLPALLQQPMTHDSFWINWVWADQFTSELANGNIYPRWMPLSHGGLGSPVFYYYPPLAFYVTGLFGLLGLSTYASIVAAFFAGFVASGFAMHAWLEDSAKSPLLGALLFMAAPYHVTDFYGRGNLAEFLAIALIPVVALGVRRAIEGRFVICALAYAALVLTHLPMALLVSLFFVAPYVLYLSRGRPEALLRVASPLLLGLAISAIYLIPALLLEPFRDSAVLWAIPLLQPEAWSLLNLSAPHPSPVIKAAVGIIILPLLFPIALLLLTPQRAWGAYAAVCCILAAALIPAFWTLPVVEKVQFPFRLLPLAEFSIATGIAHATLPRLLIYAIALTAILPPALFLTVITRTPDPGVAELSAEYPDVPENLPPGDRPWTWPSEWALQVAASHPAPRRIGDRTVEPVFYFPAWKVRCEGKPVTTAPDPDTKLLAYRGSGCDRRLVPTAAERIGAAVSLGGLLVLFVLAGLRRRGR